jgi:hypothetical protein
MGAAEFVAAVVGILMPCELLGAAHARCSTHASLQLDGTLTEPVALIAAGGSPAVSAGCARPLAVTGCFAAFTSPRKPSAASDPSSSSNTSPEDPAPVPLSATGAASPFQPVRRMQLAAVRD